MTNATDALKPPPAEASPQEHFTALRAWVAEHCLDPHPVRRSAYQMAMSAICHRLIKYGPDEVLNGLSSRDLMCLLIYINGQVAEYVMRTAYFRAIVEGEHDIYEHFNQTLFIPECRAWYWTIAEAMMARSPDPEAVTAWLENMSPEEKATARLIIARVYPDTAHIDWLGQVPDPEKPPMARLAAELALILKQKKEYLSVLKTYLREHPHVRFAVPDERWGKL
jgi:hypothetical protein